VTDVDDTMILPQQRERAPVDLESHDIPTELPVADLAEDDPETGTAEKPGDNPGASDGHPPDDPGKPDDPGDRESEESGVRLAEESNTPAGKSIDQPTQLLALDAIRAAEYAHADTADSIVASAPVVGEHRARERALAQLGWLASGLLMGALGLLRIDRPGLWEDELAAWGMTTVRWDEVSDLLRLTDVVIAPYYILLRGWTELVGDSDVMLRLPSVLAMAGSAAMIAALGSRLVSPRVGLLAGVLFALLPVTSRYAQEARPYALTTFFAVLATLLLTRAFDRPKFWRWTAYTLAVALLGVLHPVALALLAGHGFAVLLTRARLFWRWLPAAIVGAAPAAPLLYLGNSQKGQISWIPESNLDSLVAFPAKFFGVALLAGIVLALALFAISMQQPALVYTAWALIPTAVIFGAGAITPLWTPRYLLFTLPAWALLAATALGRAPLVRGLVAMLVIAVVAVPAHRAMREQDGHGQDTRRLTALLAAMASPGDGIVYGAPTTEGRVGRDIVARYIPEEKRPRDLLAKRKPRTEGRLSVAECVDYAACIGKTPRLWLVRIGEFRDPLARLATEKERPLREYEVAKTWHPEGLTLSLLVRKPA